MFSQDKCRKKNCQFKTKLSDGTGVVGQNQNVLQKRVGLWVALQLSLFCEGIAKRLCRKLYFRSGFVWRLIVARSGFRVADNVLPLCGRAGIEALNCQPAPKLNRSTNLQVCTSPRLPQNGCYGLVFYCLSALSLINFFTSSMVNGVLCL